VISENEKLLSEKSKWWLVVACVAEVKTQDCYSFVQKSRLEILVKHKYLINEKISN